MSPNRSSVSDWAPGRLTAMQGTHWSWSQETRDDQYGDVINAIRSQPEPPTRRDLLRLTHRSRRQVIRILAELVEVGEIVRYRDPSDRRIYRYIIPMVTNTPALEELPTTRAQIGYILNYATVHQGKLTPAVAVGMLAAHGVLIDDPDEAKQIAEEVFEARELYEVTPEGEVDQ